MTESPSEICEECASLPTADMLRVLIRDKFPGRTVVTASLRAPSLVVLKMIADIDPNIPVVFCQRGAMFDESLKYRKRIEEFLGLTNISMTHGGEREILPGDLDHAERMWIDSQDGSGRVYEVVHLNETLADHDCWISAVYHIGWPPQGQHRLDVEGRLVRVDPLVRWNKTDVQKFMRANKIPFHPRAFRPTPTEIVDDSPPPPSYHF